ncbi:segregation and condensation protein A [Pseudobacteriovorax antillogorgiicola]|uniref:Segregation and condensation protein A n=1 Tax=Pseudobacteriovorax antillogorgiicola TaxID=1513793 RepID=A0A1Y6B3T0_9BACT|nr:segregation/condensation protein A [Pseudobacteriovorax antillogorgiicola]TCS59249.1 condensin subunit ScpA [Pseudobacteriovorax antillogorgiicola]SME90082.1 condensin subunit ScpA [Pseudobacteriovorax antillogorgiicola]
MAGHYYLKLDQFEGPLDLLLHLIKVNEIDIFNIDIFLLTTQYLQYLRAIRYDDLSTAGEFLEMAATLVHIKTRMLLPNTEGENGEDELEEEDPRKTLQERLIAYEQFKGASEFLGVRPRYDLILKTSYESDRLAPQYEHIEAPLEGDSASLVILYEQMLAKMAERKPPAKVEAKMHMVTVEQKIDELLHLIETVKFALFQGFYKKFKSRYELVVYILAALELSKGGKIRILQQDINGPLWLYRSDFDREQLPIGAASETSQSS